MTETKSLLRKLTDAALAAKLEHAHTERVACLNRRNQAQANKMATLICRIREVQAERSA